jgi:hypothetical protein
MKQSACAPGNKFDKDICQSYTETFNLALEAVNKTF